MRECNYYLGVFNVITNYIDNLFEEKSVEDIIEEMLKQKKIEEEVNKVMMSFDEKLNTITSLKEMRNYLCFLRENGYDDVKLEDLVPVCCKKKSKVCDK